MNRFSPRWFAVCVAQLAIIGLCHAQSKTVQNKLQPPPANITIDGDPKEWGDSLPYYNKDKQINYALANDQDNIYMAIRINDRSQQIRVLRAGLTISIDPHGKKKETFSITFPVGDQSLNTQIQEANDLQGGSNDVTQQDRDDLANARLTKLREIR